MHGITSSMIGSHALSHLQTFRVNKPQGLSISDGRRPDGMTLIVWKAGNCALWDVSVIDIIAQLYVSQSSQYAGSAAELAATRKSSKYGDFFN